MDCPHCQHANPAGQKFCGECGAPLPIGPPLAAASVAAESARSYTPGHLADRILNSRSALEGERKQVTVLFCDIADSTPLAERLGAERMHGVLNAFFEVALTQVHRFEGTVNQFLGDGLMALFGAPLTHEDHARRAVLAALAIRDEVAACRTPSGGLPEGLQIRIGLNTGFVVVGKIGDNLRMDYTAIGDTTNVAARLQGQAEPGTIVISEEVRRHVHHHFELHSLGARLLKGKNEPIALYEVLHGRKGIQQAQAGEGGAGLFGREAELVMLKASIDRLANGQGGILTITGDAGCGKSRLLGAARGLAHGKALKWVEGGCVSFGKTLSYWPFREVLRGCFGIAEDDAEAESLRQLQRGLQPLFGDESDEVLPYIAAVLGLALTGPHAARISALDGVAVGHQIFRTSLRLFERLALTMPLAVALEDWHWADGSSAELLEHLLVLAGKVPILFVIASRPDAQGAAVSLRAALESDERLKSLHRPLVVPPLPGAAARLLIESVLGGGSLPAHLQEQLLRRADGNPFYLGELVRTLIATQAIERDPDSGAWQATPRMETVALPDTIEGVILARVDRLEEDAKQLLKTAAVVGRSFFYRVLRAIAEGQASLDADIDRLKAAELVENKRELPELELMFKHPLIQQAAYGSLLDDRRRRLHSQVAQCIETLFAERLEEFYSVLAHHYAQAEDWEKAYEYLFKAGDQAGRIAADAEALEHYERALTASKTSARALDPVKRAELDARIGEALFRLGRHDAALEHLFTALSYLGVSYPRSQRGVFAAILIKLFKRAIRRVMRRVVESAKPETSATDSSFVTATQVLEAIGNIDFFRNPAPFFLDILTLLELAETRPPSRALVMSTSAFGAVCDSLGLYGAASSYHAKATRIGEELGDQLALGYCYVLRGMHEYGAGKWDKAIETLSAASKRFQAAGHLHHQASVLVAKFFVFRSMGDPQWMRLVDELLEIAVGAQDEQAIGWAKGYVGSRDLYCRNYASAAKHLEEACAIQEAISDNRALTASLARWGLCEVYLGHVSRAFEHLERSRALVDRHKISGTWETRPLMSAAAAYLCAVEQAQSDTQRQQALRFAKEACARLSKLGRQVKDESAAEALRLNGIYAWLIGDKKKAQRLWTQGIEVAEKMHANYVLAKIHHELGTRTGDAKHLALARTLFIETGATPLSEGLEPVSPDRHTGPGGY